MLWTAGQQRMVREGRERLTELYVGVRDGYVAGNVATGKARARGDPTPAYARPDAEARRVLARRGLGQLIRDFPGNVGGEPEFMN
ncbi:MAG TPA: hypothetical protein VLM76_04510 [Patescibacteria group bacterium]|nr:hypothetical protein [Patescibacteria group bacterium]